MKKKYPKRLKSGFTNENETRQVNIHRGRYYDYWFIEPNEMPIKVQIGEIPQELNGIEILF